MNHRKGNGAEPVKCRSERADFYCRYAGLPSRRAASLIGISFGIAI